MILEAILLGLLIGLFRRGRISRLQYPEFKLSFLIIISILCHICIIIMNLGLIGFQSNYYVIILTVSYLSIFIFVLININLKYFFVITLGALTNLVVFFANNFKFPIKESHVSFIFSEEMYQALLKGNSKFFIPLSEAKLNFLGNIFYINKPILNDVIISIGDIIIALGIMLFIQSAMANKNMKAKSKLEFKKGLF